jgi:hypothetical protein
MKLTFGKKVTKSEAVAYEREAELLRCFKPGEVLMTDEVAERLGLSVAVTSQRLSLGYVNGVIAKKATGGDTWLWMLAEEVKKP